MKTRKQKPAITTELRQIMKEMFARELVNLPTYLNELPTKERLDYLLKLMPFVLPKVNNVFHHNGEDY